MQTKTKIILTLIIWIIFIVLNATGITRISWSLILSPIWVALSFFTTLLLAYVFDKLFRNIKSKV